MRFLRLEDEDILPISTVKEADHAFFGSGMQPQEKLAFMGAVLYDTIYKLKLQGTLITKTLVEAIRPMTAEKEEELLLHKKKKKNKATAAAANVQPTTIKRRKKEEEEKEEEEKEVVAVASKV